MAAVLVTSGVGAVLPLAADATGVAQTATTAVSGTPLTVTPNPWYAGSTFEGFGTSLAWFANVTGDYPDSIRDKLYDLLFSKDGLDLQGARYNVGGGNASDVTDYMRPGGAVEGWWKPNYDASTGGAADADRYDGTATTFANKDKVLAAWDGSDSADYDFDADQTQRWWLKKLTDAHQIKDWELFSNSAPYFMTGSGYVSGQLNTATDVPQLSHDAYQKFAEYLTTVTDYLEKTYGMSFDTIEPFNEPYWSTGSWLTKLDANGKPVASQEGMTVSPAEQTAFVKALAAQLASASTTTKATIAANDGGNAVNFLRDWSGTGGYASDADATSELSQLNVHGYGTVGSPAQVLQVRDTAKAADKPLTMSEDEGSWVSGFQPTSMANAFGFTNEINQIFSGLEPSGFDLWQPVEDDYNMSAVEKLNWGEIYTDFDCSYYDTTTGAKLDSATSAPDGDTVAFLSDRRVKANGGSTSGVPACGLQVNTKFNVLRNYTNFIQAGSQLVADDDAATTSAIDTAKGTTTLVHTNSSSSAQALTVDLSDFATVADGAKATVYLTTQPDASAQGDLDKMMSYGVQAQTPVAVDTAAKKVTVQVPAGSVATVVVDGVSGVAPTAAAVVGGHSYQLVSQASGKALAARSATGTATSIEASATTDGSDQAWTFHPVATSRADARTYVLTNGDEVLGATATGTTLTSASVDDAAKDPASRWVLSSTDGKHYSLVNGKQVLALDVSNGATADGSPVALYGSSGATNQAWTLRDLTVTGSQPVTAATLVGTAPTLPTTVTPVYAWGSGAAAPVVWNMPEKSAWDSEGQVEVQGTATDVYGQTVAVTATVDVGDYTVTDPVSVTVAEGSGVDAVKSAAPSTVPARVGASAATYPTAVTWDWSSLTADDLATPGVVTVHGTAASNDPSASGLAATLSVVVTTATDVNINPLAGTTAAATYTEKAQYSADNTRNGVTTDKGWSNWKSGTLDSSDTLTYTYDQVHHLTSATVYFFKDGDTSWAKSMQVQYRKADGTWVNAPGNDTAQPVTAPADGTAPVVDVDLGGVDATGVRFVLNAISGKWLTVSEVQVFASSPSAGAVSSLAALRTGGDGVQGFAADTHDYEVPLASAAIENGNFPVVTGVATDQAATVTVEQATTATKKATVTVTSADGSTTTSYTVTFTPAATELDSLTVVSAPLKTVYEVGEKLDATGLAVTATYQDGTTKDVSSQVRLSGFDSATKGKQTVTVSYSEAGLTKTATFGVKVIAGTTFTLLEAPVLSGNPTVGEKLRVSRATFSPNGVQTIQWLRDGEPIDGATAWVYSPTGDDEGAQVSARVTVTKTAYTSLSVTTDSVEVMVGSRLGLPAGVAVTGTAQPGEVLSTSTTASDFRPAADTVTYQWYLDGDAVSGATASTFTVPASAVGQKAHVEVTGALHGWTTSTYVSKSVKVHRAPGPVVTLLAPTAGDDGTAEVSGTVTVKVRVKADDSAITSYALRVDGVTLQSVSNASAGTYTYRLDTTALSDGDHSLVVRSGDADGRTTTLTQALTVANG